MANRAPVYQDGEFRGWVNLAPNFFPQETNHGDIHFCYDNEGQQTMVRLNIITDVLRPNWFGLVFEVLSEQQHHFHKRDEDDVPNGWIDQRMKQGDRHATH